MIHKKILNIYPNKLSTDFDNIAKTIKVKNKDFLPEHTCDETACYVKYENIEPTSIVHEFLQWLNDNKEKIKPNFEEKIYLIVPAIGAGEVYGFNINGDYVSERELFRNNAYKSFQDANVFVEHDNKDVRKAIGKVLHVIYDHKMHRVMLLLEIDPKLAPGEAIEDIKNGYTVAVSMGLNPAFDRCSICGNMAASVKDYCEHLAPIFICRVCGKRAKNPREFCEHMKANRANIIMYRPNILKYDEETGNIVGMINYGVRFHDISLVANPAEKDALATYRIDNFDKATMLVYKFNQPKRKPYKSPSIEAEMQKNATDSIRISELHPTRQAIKLVVLSEPPISKEILRKLTAFSLPQILATMSSMGILLRPREFNALNIHDIPRFNNYRELFNPFIAKLLYIYLAVRSLFDIFARRRLRHLALSDEVALMPFVEPINRELYNDLLDKQYSVIKDIIIMKRTPALTQINDMCHDVGLTKYASAKSLLTWGLLGAISPHLYAGYKITTAKRPEDIDWLTKKVYENPLGSSLAGMGLAIGANIGLRALGGWTKRKLGMIPKAASEDKWLYIPLEALDGDLEDNIDIYWRIIDKKANYIIGKMQSILQKNHQQNTFRHKEK